MSERLLEVRKVLGLSQDAFAARIGMKGSSISLLESGRRNLTEPVIKSICREFNVDYLWFTTGEGEMFFDTDNDAMTLIDSIMVGENEFHKNLLKTFAKLDMEDLKALEKIMDTYIEIKKADS